MIFKKAFFSALVVMYWVHVCSGEVPIKSSDPTRPIRPSITKTLMTKMLSINPRDITNWFIKEFLSPGTDKINQGNMDISRPQRRSSVSTVQISETKTVEIQKESDSGKNRQVPIVRSFKINDLPSKKATPADKQVPICETDFPELRCIGGAKPSEVEKPENKPDPSEAQSKQQTPLDQAKPIEEGKPVEASKPSEADSKQPTPLAQEPSPENVPSNNENSIDPSLRSVCDNMTEEEKKELALQYYTRLRDDGTTKKADIEASFKKLWDNRNEHPFITIYAEKEYKIKNTEQASVSKKKKRNDPEFWSEFNKMTTEQKNELARDFYTRGILEKDVSTKQADIEAGFKKLLDNPDYNNFIKMFAEQEYEKLNMEPSLEDVLSNDEITRDPDYVAMTYEQNVELARRRYIRLCYNSTNPFTGKVFEKNSATIDVIKASFDLLGSTYIIDLSKAEYRDFKTRKNQSESNNTTGIKNVNEMTVLEIIEMARNRYTRLRSQSINPFNNCNWNYSNITEDRIIFDFNNLSVNYIVELAKLEVEQRIKEHGKLKTAKPSEAEKQQKPEPSEADSNQQTSLAQDNSSGVVNPPSKPEPSEVDSNQPTSLAQVQHTKNYKDRNDPDFWDDFHDMNTEQKNELARNFYKRMILEKDGSAKDEDINASFEKLSKFQFLKKFLQIYAEKEYIHINTEPSPENDKNTNDPQYDAMNYELRKELAKRRYTRYYKKMIDPFTGTFIQDCPRTRDEIETYFDYLWPEYISDLSKTEYNEFIKEHMYYKNHPSVKDDPVKLEKFNKMSISDLSKTARQRYYRRREENLAPISDIPVPYADTTEEGKNYDFIQLSPYLVVSLVRAEFGLKT